MAVAEAFCRVRKMVGELYLTCFQEFCPRGLTQIGLISARKRGVRRKGSPSDLFEQGRFRPFAFTRWPLLTATPRIISASQRPQQFTKYAEWELAPVPLGEGALQVMWFAK